MTGGGSQDEGRWFAHMPPPGAQVANASQIQDENLRAKIQSKLSEADIISADCGVRQALGVLADSLLSLFQQAGSETESEWIVENLIVGKPGLKLFDRVLEDSSPGLKDSLEESSASSSSTPLEGSLAAPGGRREEARPKFDYDDKGLIVAAKSQRLEKLHEILLDIQQKFSGSGANEDVDFRGIVFVKTRDTGGSYGNAEAVVQIKSHFYV
ncbi:hypothetical protein T484DRAFT_1815806 [Baffinella frigidus]|nr:hypothetical protein T484DRAFT_1815806 [Cryptophyta sp. CCMP2293]